MADNSDRNRRICEEYASGVNSPALAKKYGLTRERIRQVLEPSGLISKKKAARKAMAAEFKLEKEARASERAALLDRAIDFVRAGMSIAKAATSVNLPSGAVRDAVKKAGVVSSCGRWNPREQEHLAARELVQNGLTAVAIGQTLRQSGFKISDAWISRHYGLAIRTRRVANDNSSSDVRIAA